MDDKVAESHGPSAIQTQFEKLETRLDRMEGILNRILEHLAVSDQGGKQQVKLDGSTSNQFESLTVLQTVDTHEKQYTDSEPTIDEDPDRRYEYTPLDPTKSQVRIIRIHRAEEFSDPLVADLVVASLDDATLKGLFYGFTPLSYTWGAPIFDGSVLLEGCKFPITKSLEIALRHLRFSYKDNPAIEINGRLWGQEVYSWIDQICMMLTYKGINQADIDERGEQVDLMRRIYKRATSVHVWLGEEADDSSMAIDLLNTLGAPPKHAPGERAINYPNFTEEEVMRHWNALRSLFKRPWWERVWIRQEIALHIIVKLWCGDKSFDMNALGPALFMLKHISSLGYASTVSHSDDESTVSLPWDFHPRALVELRRLTGTGRVWVGLGQLLRLTRSCKATDPRDTCFSVLGMADPESYPITPNYRQELNQVLLAAARAVVIQPYGLEILGACQNPEKKHGLPSWIPLLVDKWKAMPFQTVNIHGQRIIPQLTSSDTPNVHAKADILVLQGGLVDTIGSICKSFIKNGAGMEDMEFVYSSWKRFAKDAWMQKQLRKKDINEYVECDDQKKMRNWIRFLTVLVDEAEDLNENSGLYKPPQSLNDKSSDSGMNDLMKNPYPHIPLNPRLARSYLLPTSHLSASLHPNHRIHAGLQAHGVGRRLCVTKRGLLALIPAEAQTGDRIAVLRGATFPYVLRDFTAEGHKTLVGEAFIPSWIGGIGEKNTETFMSEEWKVGLSSWIWIC